MMAHRNHVEAQVARSRRNRSRLPDADAIDASVLLIFNKWNKNPATWNWLTADEISWRLPVDGRVNSLRVAASLKRLKKRGLVDYSAYSKRWSTTSPEIVAAGNVVPLRREE